MTTTQNLLNGVTAQAASGKDLTQKIKVKVIDEAGNKVRVKQEMLHLIKQELTKLYTK